MPKRVIRHAVTQPQDPTIRLIPLTQNQNAIVDASDYEWLMQWNWRAFWADNTQSFYAAGHDSASGHKHWMHRRLFGLEYGDKKRIDHINHNTLDNRRSNLRIATRSENMMNRKKQANNHSGYKGVCFDGSKWQAQIGVNGARIYLGLFCTPEEAFAAYCEAAKKLYGEFAKLD